MKIKVHMLLINRSQILLLRTQFLATDQLRNNNEAYSSSGKEQFPATAVWHLALWYLGCVHEVSFWRMHSLRLSESLRKPLQNISFTSFPLLHKLHVHFTTTKNSWKVGEGGKASFYRFCYSVFYHVPYLLL